MKLYASIVESYKIDTFYDTEFILEEIFMVRSYSYSEEEQANYANSLEDDDEVDKYDEYGRRTKNRKKPCLEANHEEKQTRSVYLCVTNYEECPEVNDYYSDGATFAILNLGGVYYAFAQDPNDGYRSSLGGIYQIEFDDIDLFNEAKEKNLFDRYKKGPSLIEFKKTHIPPSEEDEYNCFRGITGVSPFNQNIIVWLGTANYDDYYPYFKAHIEEAEFLNSIEPTQSLLEKEKFDEQFGESQLNNKKKRLKV